MIIQIFAHSGILRSLAGKNKCLHPFFFFLFHGKDKVILSSGNRTRGWQRRPVMKFNASCCFFKLLVRIFYASLPEIVNWIIFALF